ncbi:MAG: hydroxyethylthiazole kinase [Synergistaceae bacterium]|jgi:hydroxyethylthiazole kinase|nr:hydroxyethylthiazole kinase [Synergistaceae bacterium]
MSLTTYKQEEITHAWAALKEKRPLVFHVTNAVASALQANVCLAIGASPLMSQYPEETEELMELAQGFLVNLGTPTDAAWATVKRGMAKAESRGCVLLLDPVGYGASRFRTENTNALLREHRFSILKGNAGEISLLAGVGGETKGVDALSAGNLKKGVAELSQKYGCVTCATGEVDYLSDGESVLRISGGSALLPYLSGSGCVVGTVALSVSAACGDPALGTLCGLLAMGIASERAEEKCMGKGGGSGTFPALLIDELYRLSPEDLPAGLPSGGARWSEI